MLTRNTEIHSEDQASDELTAVGTKALGTLDLVRFYLVECGILRDRAVVYAILSSVSRSGLILAINNVAVHPGKPLPLTLLVLSVVSTLLFSFLARMRNFEISTRLLRDLRLAMSKRLLNADVGFLQRRERGQVFNAMTYEVATVSEASSTAVGAIEAGLVLLLCIPYLAWVSWPTGIATIVAVLIGGAGYLLSEAPARRLGHLSNTATATFYDRVDDMLAGWMELRLRRSRRQGLEHDIAATVEDARHHSVESERYFTRGDTFAQLSLILLLCAIVVVMPLFQGADTTAMFQLLTTVLLAYAPIEVIFGALPRLSRAVTAQHKIADLVTDLVASREAPPLATLPPRSAFQRIELRGVTATVTERGTSGPDEEAFHLGPIDLTFTPGETVFICGGNGAGKTTLLALLTGLRHPDKGEVLLDGRPMTPADAGDYRSLFSAVFSQFHLFRKAYGLEPDERELLGAMIEELGLSDRVSLIESEFSTIQLSSGQRRRLALAVALAERRPIIVLDEFAADQDPQRRAFFYDVLVPRMARDGHLVIAVTHDEHNFSKCDRLIRMDAGKVVSDVRMTAADRQQGVETVR